MNASTKHPARESAARIVAIEGLSGFLCVSRFVG